MRRRTTGRLCRRMPNARAAALCCALVLFGFGMGGCGKQPSVVVSLSNVPSETATLRVLTNLDSRPAQELPALQTTRQERYSFGLRYPEGSEGTVQVSVGAYSATNCLLSTVGGSVPLTPEEQTLNLQLNAPEAEYMATCKRSLPAIRRIVQSPTANGRRLLIDGFGFLPQSRVTIDGMPTTGFFFKSPERLEVDEPTISSPSGKRSIELIVVNPDTNFDTIKVDLLSILFEDLAANTYQLPAKHNPQAVALGDVSGDGLPDVVVTGFADKTKGFVAVYINNGNGKLADPAVYPTPGTSHGVGIADFNGDGKLDITVTNADSASVSILLNQGNGTFPLSNPTVPAGPKPYYLATPDIDSDGLTDIVVVNDPLSTTGNSQGSFLVSQGNGGFTPYINVNVMDILMPGLNIYGPLITSDVNNDGRSDLILHFILPEFTAMGVVTHGAATTITQNGNGSFSYTLITTDLNYGGLGIVDINKDGRNDFVESGLELDVSKPMEVRTFFQEANTSFTLQQPTYQAGARTTVPGSLATGDLNGDGWQDMLVLNSSERAAGFMYSLLNYKNGAFTDQTPPAYPFGVGEGFVTTGDLNKDGRIDVVVAASGNYKDGLPGSLHVYLNATR